MIVLSEKRDGASILHIVIGPETDFHFDLNGQSTMDISEYVHSFPAGEKVVLTINRCDSEEMVLRSLAYEQNKIKADRALQEAMKIVTQDTKTQQPKQRTEPPKHNKQKCPKCGKPNSAVVMSGNVYPCDTCQKIDKELDKGVPPPPGKDELKRIQDSIIEQNPDQKESLRRFVDRYKKRKEGQDGGSNNDIRPDTGG